RSARGRGTIKTDIGEASLPYESGESRKSSQVPILPRSFHRWRLEEIAGRGHAPSERPSFPYNGGTTRSSVPVIAVVARGWVIEDHYRRLGAAHLAALADEMALSLAEVYEVASFYAHFDIVREGEPGPPGLTVRVCESLTCALFGGERLCAELAGRLGPDVRVVPAPCVGRCEEAPVAVVGHRAVGHARSEGRRVGKE